MNHMNILGGFGLWRGINPRSSAFRSPSEISHTTLPFDLPLKLMANK
jgi:hypothetical protein